MTPEGRTMSEARAAGNWFSLSGPEGFEYDPPAATDPWEVIRLAHRRWILKSGKYQVRRVLPEGRIGAEFVEDVGEPLTWDGERWDREVI